MAISRRRLRFRPRFGFGLAAGGWRCLMLLVPGAYAAKKAKPKPKPRAPHKTAATDQYKPTTVTYVTLNAARVGKCKRAVTQRFVPKRRACKGKKVCLRAVTKTRARCHAAVQPARTVGQAKAKAKPKTNPRG